MAADDRTSGPFLTRSSLAEFSERHLKFTVPLIWPYLEACPPATACQQRGAAQRRCNAPCPILGDAEWALPPASLFFVHFVALACTHGSFGVRRSHKACLGESAASAVLRKRWSACETAKRHTGVQFHPIPSQPTLAHAYRVSAHGKGCPWGRDRRIEVASSAPTRPHGRHAQSPPGGEVTVLNVARRVGHADLTSTLAAYSTRTRCSAVCTS
ncbi:hypothetical protein OH76DRAFT_1185887 [Lentinus brumalis]|uniref:Uncharacterized protein n=1 Tax=Lentinus brumalis TaxID=2498619 RepID=A0A371CTR5_9APHY|nr:hypothetical protein OH76DRAFT_1185887 [Polyporus brumalis]